MWTRPVRITVLVFTVGVTVFRNGPDPDVTLRCLFVLNTALVEGFLRTRRVNANPTGPDRTARPVRVYKWWVWDLEWKCKQIIWHYNETWLSSTCSVFDVLLVFNLLKLHTWSSLNLISYFKAIWSKNDVVRVYDWLYDFTFWPNNSFKCLCVCRGTPAVKAVGSLSLHYLNLN